ncbi:YeeE/YedE family protein [Noviherbaspirillum pedocola]|uniref:YeeE/YedE family protein n=1 Tax=Noviherbaspirillum pedocola TaxID=2801341 RepID=A0A934STL2_9BURK|nr:YeeE/YedE family protein [Noviherbaspirillum pedocola]MBK4734976.1 YeeE/YedE family protein [Noviherbaspirillum pedocola]
MNMDWTHFTPWTSLAGGILIGISAALFILLNGRIAGISGILGGLLHPVKHDVLWRAAFLGGLIIAPLLYRLLVPLPQVTVDADAATLITAGLLVGIGTRYGAGCTSGHGVCGISRLSPRSLVATACFMAAGFVTVFIVRHLLA